MKVVRMRRGWRVNLSDLEYQMLREAVRRGLSAIDAFELDDRLPYKIRKVLRGDDSGPTRWTPPNDPLAADEDRRPVEK